MSIVSKVKRWWKKPGISLKDRITYPAFRVRRIQMPFAKADAKERNIIYDIRPDLHYKYRSVFEDSNLIQKIITLGKLDKNSKVIELGSGQGHNLKSLSPHVKKIKGIELSETMQKWSKYHTEGLQNVKHVHGDITKLNLKPKSADLIFGYFIKGHIRKQMLELFPKWEKFVKSGKKIILIDQDSSELRKKPREKPDKPTPREIIESEEKALENYGFKSHIIKVPIVGKSFGEVKRKLGYMYGKFSFLNTIMERGKTENGKFVTYMTMRLFDKTVK